MASGGFKQLSNGELKEHFKGRLRAAGKYEQFIRVRERLKAQGLSPGEAWEEAAKLFPAEGKADELPDGVLSLVSPAMTDVDEVRMAGSAKAEVERLLAEGEELDAGADGLMWRKLAEGVGGRKASELDAIRWVAENIQTPLGELDVEEIPSAMAVNWLRWVRASDVNENKFWESSMVKLLPDKKSLDQDSGMRDDGREVLDAIGKVQAARERAESR